MGCETSSVVCSDGSIIVVGAYDNCETPHPFVLSGVPGGEFVAVAAIMPRLYTCVVQVAGGFSIVGGALYDEEEGDHGTTHDLVVVGHPTQSKASMPVPKAQHSGAFGADMRLYIGGGDIDTEADPWFAGSNLTVYDEATGWGTVPNSDDFAFTQSAMVAYGRFIVTVGGITGWSEEIKNVITGQISHTWTSEKSGQVMLYDTRGGTFYRLPPLQTPRRGHKIAVCGTKLFVLGDGPPEVLRLPPLSKWTRETTSEHSPKFRRAVSVIVHSCARSNVLNDDCTVMVISYLHALDFDFD
jgi:hypothetical protein